MANRFEAQLSAHQLPRPTRRAPSTLQVFLSGPRMQRLVVERILLVLGRSPSIRTVELCGSAELNPSFQRLVNGTLALERQLVLRCASETFEQPGRRDLADFLAVREVALIAPLPGETADPLDVLRVRGLRRLNALGYGRAEGHESRPGLRLDLTCTPPGPALPAVQSQLEAQVRARLRERHGVVFDRLHALVNMPVGRCEQELEAQGQLAAYRELLERAFNPAAAGHVMCRDVVHVDWDGHLYDCEFNRALGLALGVAARGPATIFAGDDLAVLDGAPVSHGDHCLGCAAGQGSGCRGALVVAPAGAAASASPAS